MTATTLLLAAAAIVFVLGVVVTLTVTDLIRRVIALNVASGGVMLILLTLADRGADPDPVPQALVLTGIVVMAAVTGLALTLARRVEGDGDDLEPDEDAAGGAP